jgi:hypothetical protein
MLAEIYLKLAEKGWSRSKKDTFRKISKLVKSAHNNSPIRTDGNADSAEDTHLSPTRNAGRNRLFAFFPSTDHTDLFNQSPTSRHGMHFDLTDLTQFGLAPTKLDFGPAKTGTQPLKRTLTSQTNVFLVPVVPLTETQVPAEDPIDSLEDYEMTMISDALKAQTEAQSSRSGWQMKSDNISQVQVQRSKDRVSSRSITPVSRAGAGTPVAAISAGVSKKGAAAKGLSVKGSSRRNSAGLEKGKEFVNGATKQREADNEDTEKEVKVEAEINEVKADNKEVKAVQNVRAAPSRASKNLALLRMATPAKKGGVAKKRLFKDPVKQMQIGSGKKLDSKVSSMAEEDLDDIRSRAKDAARASSVKSIGKLDFKESSVKDEDGDGFRPKSERIMNRA